MPSLSVIIVGYKGYSRLKQCLDSLACIDNQDMIMEVIVVNNCPEDSQFRHLLAFYPSFRFIENSHNRGFGSGSNLGASIAQGDFSLFLNPDTIVTEQAIIELLNFLCNHPSIMAATCKQVNDSGKEVVAWGSFPNYNNLTGVMRKIFSSGYQSQIKQREGFPPEVFFPDWISGSAILIRKEDFIALQGFDEDFWMYFEDVDLCRRIRNMGREIAVCSNVSIIHHHGGSSRGDLKTASITKSEVLVSKHLYISKHTFGLKKVSIQTLLVINHIVWLFLAAAAGLILFFIPKLLQFLFLFSNLIVYYSGCLIKRTWISPRTAHHL
jgi:GT2 family glycosyltransferase